MLYIEGEDTFTIEDGDKMTFAILDRKKYSLSSEAMREFEKVHDDWELNICKNVPHDVLVGDIHVFHVLWENWIELTLFHTIGYSFLAPLAQDIRLISHFCV